MEVLIRMQHGLFEAAEVHFHERRGIDDVTGPAPGHKQSSALPVDFVPRHVIPHPHHRVALPWVAFSEHAVRERLQ
jgi:hypothetical protein